MNGIQTEKMDEVENWLSTDQRLVEGDMAIDATGRLLDFEINLGVAVSLVLLSWGSGGELCGKWGGEEAVEL